MDDFWGHIWAAVQAGGSIAAIGWAIWLWRRDKKLADERTEARARVLAYRLLPVLADIDLASDKVLKAADHIEKNAAQEKIESVLLALDKGLVLPPQVPDSIYQDFACLEPDLARTLAHVFYSMEHFNRSMRDLLEVARHSPSEILPMLYPNVRGRIQTIRTDLANCDRLFIQQFGQEVRRITEQSSGERLIEPSP